MNYKTNSLNRKHQKSILLKLSELQHYTILGNTKRVALGALHGTIFGVKTKRRDGDRLHKRNRCSPEGLRERHLIAWL